MLEVDPANVRQKGRLQPGKMFLVDFEQGRIIADEELKDDVAGRRPYSRWLENKRVQLSDLPPADTPEGYSSEELVSRMRSFGYTTETLQFMLLPLLAQQKDPIGSMGNDAALACLSDHPRML